MVIFMAYLLSVINMSVYVVEFFVVLQSSSVMIMKAFIMLSEDAEAQTDVDFIECSADVICIQLGMTIIMPSTLYWEM